MRLQLTRRGDYAIRGMLVLAQNPTEILSGAEIARRTQIPGRLVIQVMGDLVHAGLIEGRLGRHGGYRLARDPAGIPMLTIVEAAEGDSRRTSCVLRGTACTAGNTCAVHEIFAGAQEALIRRLADASLATAVELLPAGIHGTAGVSGSAGAASTGASH
jgi:Rrf2 family iron-sulfur cluster assembly transcriptional regulator